jgi:hypothetical protein
MVRGLDCVECEEWWMTHSDSTPSMCALRGSDHAVDLVRGPSPSTGMIEWAGTFWRDGNRRQRLDEGIAGRHGCQRLVGTCSNVIIRLADP